MWDKINILRKNLRVTDQRLKENVDYAIMCKAGETTVVCDPIWSDTIIAEARKISLTVNVILNIR